MPPGGGHTWPGSAIEIPPGEAFGNKTHEISANDLMWDFFLNHTLEPMDPGKDPDGDTDGDGIPNGTDPDDDNDGCTDEQELGNDETVGGRRNTHNFWDFFDPNRDSSVTLLDFLAILRHFGAVGDPSAFDPDAPEPPIGEYWALADRGGQAPGGNPWDELPANGSIGLTDFLSVLRQFGHTCR